MPTNQFLFLNWNVALTTFETISNSHVILGFFKGTSFMTAAFTFGFGTNAVSVKLIKVKLYI